MSRSSALRGVYNFEASYDPTTGGLRFSPLRLVGLDGLATSTQALWCGMNVVLDGSVGTNPPETFELVSDALLEDEACFGGAYPAPTFLFEADGALCSNVTVRSFYSTPLDRVYAQITEFTGSSDYIPYDSSYPGVDTAPAPADAELIGGVSVPSAGLGLWSYGDLGAAGSVDPALPDSRALSWIFRNGREIENFAFTGTIYAAIAEDCATPGDDNCNGRANEGCGLYALGAACETDFDCASANCNGATGTCDSSLCGDLTQNGSETDIDCGGACAANCSLGEGCSVDADCDSNVCQDSVCASYRRPSQAGQIVVTEFLANPASVADSVGEWIELYNPTSEDFDLNGCAFTDENGTGEQFNVTTQVIVPAGGYALVGGSTDPAANGGLSIALGFDGGYALANSGDEIELRCGGTLIDAVSYTTNSSGYATQLSVDTLTAVANDSASNLCIASTQIPGYAEYGTPGSANESCALTGVECTVVSPVDDFNAASGATLGGEVAVFVPFLTDISTGANPSPNLQVQGALVATGVDPSSVADGSWTDATLASGYAAASPYSGSDKYLTALTVPDDVGNTYRYVFRARGDGSASWILCDPDGSANGFTLESTAVVTVDATAPTPTDVGQIIFTEALVNGGNDGSIEPNEFVEIMNVTGNAIQLQGCEVTSNSPTETFTITTSTIIQPQSFAIIGRADHLYPVPAGVPLIVHPTNALAFGNSTSGERVEIYCPGAANNPVAAITDLSVNDVAGVSRQVALSDVSNTNPISSLTMCETPLGTFDMGLGDNGTPGFANVECNVIAAPTLCYLSADNPTQGFVGADTVVTARVVIPGVTDASAGNNANVQVMAEFGFGPADTDPTLDPAAFDWTAATLTSPYTAGGATIDEDQYEAALNVPADASGAIVARFSVDGGDSFSVYCDSTAETPVAFDVAAMQPISFSAAPVLADCFEVQGPSSAQAYPDFTSEVAVAVHVTGITDASLAANGLLQVELGMDTDAGPPATAGAFDSWQVLGSVDPDSGNEDIYFGDITYPELTARTVSYAYRVTYDGVVLGYCDGVNSTTFAGSTFQTYNLQAFSVDISAHDGFDVPAPASIEDGQAIEATFVLGMQRVTDRFNSGPIEAELSPLVQVRHILVNTGTGVTVSTVTPTFDTSIATADVVHEYKVSLSPGVGTYSSTFEVSVDGGLTWGDAATQTFEVTAGAGGPGPGVVSTYWINEVHYDNSGADVDEAIEIAGPPGATTPASLQIVLYNGGNNLTYGSIDASGVTLSDDGQVGFYTFVLPSNTLQNGGPEPDGIALVGPSGLIEFLSYEGTMVGSGGAADGITSTDIGTEASTSPVGFSLQRAGTGCSAADFNSWDPSAANTYDAVNTNQTFDCGDDGGGSGGGPVTAVWINEITYRESSPNEGIEIAAAPETDLTGYRVLYYASSGNFGSSSTVSGSTPASSDPVSFLFVARSGLSNSAGQVVLVDASDNVVDHISWGSVSPPNSGAGSGSTATAAGTTSPGTGTSIGLVGTGCGPEGFTWDRLNPITSGAINGGQTLSCGP